MKSLSMALVAITLIVCGFVFGLPEINKARELSLAERALAMKERDVHLQIVFVQPAPRPRGMQMEPPKESVAKQ